MHFSSLGGHFLDVLVLLLFVCHVVGGLGV